MKPVRFLRPAELELLDAAQYYETQAPGLGLEFLNKIDAAIVDIGEADKLTCQRRLSRSSPHTVGLEPVIQQHGPSDITDALNEVHGDHSGELDEVWAGMQTEAIPKEDW